MVDYFWITGNATSPNYPGTYPYNLEKTETIKVESGEIVLLWFNDFDVFALTEPDDSGGLDSDSDTVVDVDPCPYDYVQVTDGDGTILMNKSCGYMKVDRYDPNYFLPANITSNTNVVDIFFKTDGNGARTGWSLGWRAMTPGPGHLPACPALPPILGQRCDIAPAGPQDCYYAGNHFIFVLFLFASMPVTTAAVGAASQVSSSPASRARPMAKPPGRRPSVLQRVVRAQVHICIQICLI